MNGLMLCPNCGQVNADIALTCRFCNKILTPASAGSPPAAPAEDRPRSAIPLNPPRQEVYPPQNTGNYAGDPYPGAAPVVGVSGLPYMNPPQQPVPQYVPPQQPMYGVPANPPAQPYGYGYNYAYAAPGYGAAAPPALCAVCGTPLYINYNRCFRCLTPRGWIVNPNDPAAATYVPQGYIAPTLPMVFANEPEADTPKAGEAPPGWNWGAALQTTCWSAAHRIVWASALSGVFSLFWIALGIFLLTNSRALTSAESVILTTLSTLGLLVWVAKALYLGMQGNRLAWRTRRDENVERFRQTQRLWAGWSIALFALSAILLGVVFMVAFRK